MYQIKGLKVGVLDASLKDLPSLAKESVFSKVDTRDLATIMNSDFFQGQTDSGLL